MRGVFCTGDGGSWVSCFDDGMRQLGRGGTVVAEWSLAGASCAHARGSTWAAGQGASVAWGRVGAGALRVEHVGRRVACVSVSRAGAVAAGLEGKGGGVAVLECESGLGRGPLLGQGEAAACLEWTSERAIAVGTAHKWLRLYDARGGAAPAASVAAHERAVDGLRQEEGGPLLVSLGVREGLVKVWDSRQLRRPLLALPVGPGLRDAALRGRRLAVACAERPAVVYSLWGEPPAVPAEEEAVVATNEEAAASLEVLGADRRVRRHTGRGAAAACCWGAGEELALLQPGGAVELWAVGREPLFAWAPDGLLAVAWPRAPRPGLELRPAPTEEPMQRRALKGYALDPRANAALMAAEEQPSAAALWQLVGAGPGRHSGAAGLLAGLDSGTYHLGSLQLWGGAQREAALELVRPALEPREHAALLALQGRVADGVTQLQAAGQEATAALLAGLDAQGGSAAWRAAVLRVRESGLVGAVLRVLGGQDWQEAVRGLALSRRLCLALLMLNDLALVQWVAATTAEEIAQGSLEALLLTGLQKAALPALQAYLDRTGDVQTCALVVAGLVPSRFRDPTAERWVEVYRGLLDRWGLSRLRAGLDLARRGPQEDEGSGPVRLGVSAAASQIYIRCNNCDQSLALAMMVPSKMSLRTAGTKTGHSVTRVKSCPSPKCRETLPRCVLCLLPVECTAPLGQVTQADSVLLQDNYFTFCTLCRHGGHADHILSWFATNDACPVSGCECFCNK